MNVKFPAGTLTNELLLSIMPFGSAYLLEEGDGAPLEDSVMFAVAIQSIQYCIDPLMHIDADKYTIN